MATITNNNVTISVNDTIFQKEDLSINRDNTKVVFNDGKVKYEVEYSEITSPFSENIDNLFEILSTYLNSTGGTFGTVDENNVSNTLLTASSTFTGMWTNVSAYSSIIVATKTNQNGKIYIDFSPDGVNTDSTLTRYYRTDQIEPPHRFTITRKYARIRFENTSASDQTYLRLQTLLGNQSDLNSPCDSVLSQDFDAQSVRPTNFNYETALNLRQGRTTWNKWGYNTDIDNGVTEIVASFGGTFTRLTTASTLSVVSTDANDTAEGTGARSIIIYGIDTNREAIIEVVSLNGTTPVTTSNSYLGVNRLSIYLSGSGGVNAGTINATATTGGSTQGQIPLGEGSTQQAIFFTQAGHTALIDWLYLNVVKISGGGGSPKVTLKMWVHSFVSGSRYEVFREIIDTTIDNNIQLTPSQPFVVAEKSVVYLEATTDTNNTGVSARFSLIEFKNVATE